MRCDLEWTRLSLYDAIAQAKRDAGDRLPVVAHRRNNCEWLAILPLTDLLAILRESSYVETTSTPRPRGGIPDAELEALEAWP